MNELFLGVIAAAVLVMAIIQVAAIVFAARAARRVTDAVTRLEQGVQPIVTNLQQVSADAARMTASAATQVERAGQLLEGIAGRVDGTMTSIQDTILGPARDGLAFLQSLRSILSAFRPDGARTRGSQSDDDDALFIG